jgi:hypothetical protein
MWHKIQQGENNDVDRGLVRKPAGKIVHGTYRCRRQVKVKQSHYRPDNRLMKVARLSALRTDRLYLQEIFRVLMSVRG